MELVKKNIHTERIKAKAILQIPMEADLNVSDTKPDVSKIVFTREQVKIDELKTGTNKIWIKARLVYQILYLADGKEQGLAGMEGELPIMEEVYLDAAESGDHAVCTINIEDMRVNVINSRKLSIQAVLTLMPRIEETITDEVCTDLTGDTKGIEYRKKPLEYLETTVSKRDLFRIHEDNKLPAGLPPIGSILWKSANISRVAFRPLADKIAVSGEINLFLIYTEDTSGRINWYETTIPFSGNVECMGCEENLIADISYQLGHEEITIRDDSDGEARMLSIEMTLELELRLWKKESAPVVSDVYGVSCEVSTVTRPEQFRRLREDMYLEEKLTGTLHPEGPDSRIIQIAKSEAGLTVENCIFGEEEVTIEGNMELRILYLGGENAEYAALHEEIPFRVTRHIAGVSGAAQMENCSIHPQLEQLHIAIKDGDRMEWQALVSVRLMLYEDAAEEILCDLKIGELDAAKLERLPGFAIYFVKEGDTLWQIGRNYYVSVNTIKEVNQLTSDDLKSGERLLIVKSGEI